jgi:hypothetical protein
MLHLGIQPWPTLVEKLQAQAIKRRHDFKALDLAVYIWSLASLKVRPSNELIDVLYEECKYDPTLISPHISVSKSLGQSARHKKHPKALRLTADLWNRDKVDDFNAENVANIYWSIATLALPIDRNLLGMLGDQVLSPAQFEGFGFGLFGRQVQTKV